MNVTIQLRLTLLILFSGSFCGTGKAQVVFCPPGATWNYSFLYIPTWNGIYTYVNEQVKYVNDTLIDGDSAKVLTHRFYYAQCYNTPSVQKKTYIKQKGDTIFFRNARTQDTWQILYNYASAPGGSWTTTLLKADNSPITYTITVDSVSQITENGFSLKRLYVLGGHLTGRLGSSGFLFNFHSYANGCDGYYFADFLCYSDSSFGQIVFTEKSCDYSGSVNMAALTELVEEEIRIFPNPATETINVYSGSHPIENITIRTLTGQNIKSPLGGLPETSIRIGHLLPGIYFIEIRSGDNIIRRKFIKE